MDGYRLMKVGNEVKEMKIKWKNERRGSVVVKKKMRGFFEFLEKSLNFFYCFNYFNCILERTDCMTLPSEMWSTVYVAHFLQDSETMEPDRSARLSKSTLQN